MVALDGIFCWCMAIYFVLKILSLIFLPVFIIRIRARLLGFIRNIAAYAIADKLFSKTTFQIDF